MRNYILPLIVVTLVLAIFVYRRSASNDSSRTLTSKTSSSASAISPESPTTSSTVRPRSQDNSTHRVRIADLIAMMGEPTFDATQFLNAVESMGIGYDEGFLLMVFENLKTFSDQALIAKILSEWPHRTGSTILTQWYLNQFLNSGDIGKAVSILELLSTEAAQTIGSKIIARKWAEIDPGAFLKWYSEQGNPVIKEGAALGFRNHLLPMTPDEAVDFYNKLDRSELPEQIVQALDEILIEHLLDRDADAAIDFALAGGGLADTIVSDPIIRSDRAIIERVSFEKGKDYLNALIDAAPDKRVDAALRSFVATHVKSGSPEFLFAWIDGIQGDGQLRENLRSKAFTELMVQNLPAAKAYLEKLPPSHFKDEADAWVDSYESNSGSR